MRNNGADSQPQVSELLVRWRDGDHGALEQSVPLVYDELRRLARSYLRQNSLDWKNRAHFFAIAARLMRQILVDRTRKLRAAKRCVGACLLRSDES
jgi:hypothetical protein